MRASSWPASTNCPSSTSMLATRPPSLLATSTSVASRRPLPQAKPSPRPFGRISYQISRAMPATMAVRMLARIRRCLARVMSAPCLAGTRLLCGRRGRVVLMIINPGPFAAAVAAAMLGLIQRLVALGDQLLRAGLLLRVGGDDADAQGQAAQRTAGVGQVQGGKALMDALGQMAGALQAGIGQDDGELLAAVAAGHVALALQAVVEQLAHPAQGVIARQVTEGVVVGLEVVDIHQQQGKWCAQAPQPTPFGLQLLVEVAPVVQSGQAILLGQALPAGLQTQGLALVPGRARP